MIELQGHFRVIAEYLDRIFLVVLTADSQQGSLAALFEKKRLQYGAMFVDLHAARAIFARHSLPQGVVQIENRNLDRCSPECVELACDGSSERCEILRGKRHSRQTIAFRIMYAFNRVPVQNFGGLQQVQAADLPQFEFHFLINFAEHSCVLL